MIQFVKLSEYQKLTGKTPAMTKKLINDGKLIGGQDGPRGHWYVQINTNDDLSELRQIIEYQGQMISVLCRHLGVDMTQFNVSESEKPYHTYK